MSEPNWGRGFIEAHIALAGQECQPTMDAGATLKALTLLGEVVAMDDSYRICGVSTGEATTTHDFDKLMARITEFLAAVNVPRVRGQGETKD